MINDPPAADTPSQFIDLNERSRGRVRAERGIPSHEMRRRLASAEPSDESRNGPRDRAANQLWIDTPVRFYAPADKQHFTDADVAHLAPCIQLRLFYMNGTAITDR